jgi:hypothetical protein
MKPIELTAGLPFYAVNSAMILAVIWAPFWLLMGVLWLFGMFPTHG